MCEGSASGGGRKLPAIVYYGAISPVGPTISFENIGSAGLLGEKKGTVKYVVFIFMYKFK